MIVVELSFQIRKSSFENRINNIKKLVISKLADLDTPKNCDNLIVGTSDEFYEMSIE